MRFGILFPLLLKFSPKIYIKKSRNSPNDYDILINAEKFFTIKFLTDMFIHTHDRLEALKNVNGKYFRVRTLFFTNLNITDNIFTDAKASIVNDMFVIIMSDKVNFAG